MIYAVARAAVIVRLFQEHDEPRKQAGGFVWRTREAAQRYIDYKRFGADYAVFGVLADWERDTESVGQEWRRLRKDADVVILRPHSA